MEECTVGRLVLSEPISRESLTAGLQKRQQEPVVGAADRQDACAVRLNRVSSCVNLFSVLSTRGSVSEIIQPMEHRER